MVYYIFFGYCGNLTDSTLKNEENAAADFGQDQMMPKDTTVVEVDMMESEKAKAGSEESKITEDAGLNKNGRLVKAAMEAGLENTNADMSNTRNHGFLKGR